MSHIKESNVQSLKDLFTKVEEIKNLYNGPPEYKNKSLDQMLYRGQPDHEYFLKSTLSRHSKISSLKEYLYLCDLISDKTNSVLKENFERIKKPAIDNFFNTIHDRDYGNFPWLKFLLYIRHYGFPSPFLDWSKSLSIALGFAFFEHNNSEYRSIYIYWDSPNGAYHWSFMDDFIFTIGEYVDTDNRHFLQQSNYTILSKFVEKDAILGDYDSFVNTDDLDMIWKINISSNLRPEILRYLQSVNISPYSIAPSNENLMKTLWLEQYLNKNY